MLQGCLQGRAISQIALLQTKSKRGNLDSLKCKRKFLRFSEKKLSYHFTPILFMNGSHICYRGGNYLKQPVFFFGCSIEVSNIQYKGIKL